MLKKILTISNELGLHARPAAMFVQLTSRYKSKITVFRGTQKVDGKSIMGLLMLAAKKGSKLQLIIEGEDEEDLLRELTALFDKKFEED
jgi:phosphocarrier protein HPr